MEDFQSAGTDGWSECVTSLESCDVYVLLLGHNYGSALADTGLSYTHAEYERARALAMPVFPFVKSGIESAMWQARDPLRLQDFYATVMEAHVVRQPLFRDTDELADSIRRAFDRWESREKTGRPYFSRQRTSIAEPMSYAVSQVRRDALVRSGFSILLVDAQTALADHLPVDSPGRLLRKALEIRAELTRLGAGARFVDDVVAYGKTREDVFIKRVALAGHDTSLIICFVHGRADYPLVSAFLECDATVAALVPRTRLTIDDANRRADVYLGYVDHDIVTCALSREVTGYVRHIADEHLLAEF